MCRHNLHTTHHNTQLTIVNTTPMCRHTTTHCYKGVHKGTLGWSKAIPYHSHHKTSLHTFSTILSLSGCKELYHLSEKDNRKSTDLPRLIPQSQQIPSGQRLIEEIKGKSKDAQPKSTPPSLAPKSTPPSLAPKSTPPPLAPKSTPPSLGSKGKLEHSVFVTNSTGHSQKVKVKVKLLEIRSAAEIDLVVFEVCEGLGLGTRYMRG